MDDMPKVPKRLVISNLKGGSAKSSTARNLAVIAAVRGLSVVTVDTDQQKTLTRWFENRPASATPIRHFEADLLDVDGLTELRGFDLMVVDTPPLSLRSSDGRNDEGNLRMLNALVSLSDFCLVPCGQHLEDLASTEVWLQFLKTAGAKYGSVLTITSRRTKSFERAKSRLNKISMLCPIDVQRVEDIPYSHEFGLGVVEIAKAKGKDDFEGVWDFVAKNLGFEE